MERTTQHEQKIKALQTEVLEANLQNQKIILSRKGTRNTTRKKVNLGHRVEVSNLNQILLFDVEKKEIWVEPGVSMKTLIQVTSKKGLFPKVVPEFKEITVGGAIQGGALESSSFKHGQFNDSCASFELLLGNGDVLWVSPKDNSDLFYGVSSSYGTLALLCSVKISLERHPKNVHLELFRFDSFSRMSRALKTMLPLSHYDFLEGIGYHSNQWVLIAGKTVEEKGRHFLNVTKHSPWYYEQIYKLSLQKVDEVEMSLKTYLFRHDQGAFWMASYLKSWKTFLLYLFSRKPEKDSFIKLIEELKSQPFQFSSSLLRGILGPRLSSKSLYKVLHKMPSDWVREHLMIQDCYIPLKNLDTFVQFVQEKLNLFPLWFCPIKSGGKDQILAPHSSYEAHFFVNVGLYGIPKTQISAKELTLVVEEKVYELGGRKMLYGHNFYTQEHFWKHYDYTSYENLRKKYSSDRSFYPITDKILKP